MGLKTGTGVCIRFALAFGHSLRELLMPAFSALKIGKLDRLQGEAAVIAAYIDEFIMFCAGLWMAAVGFGYLSFPTPNQGAQNAWLANLVGHFRWMGPLLLAIAIVLAIASPA